MTQPPGGPANGKHRRRTPPDQQPTMLIHGLAATPPEPPPTGKKQRRPKARQSAPEEGTPWLSSRPVVVILVVAVLVLATLEIVRITSNRFDQQPTAAAPPPPPMIITEPPPVPIEATEAGSVNRWQRIDGDEFDGAAVDEARWNVYRGFKAPSQETWDPRQCTVRNGVLTLTGAPEPTGRSCGMGSRLDQLYGRWEVRVRFPVPADPDFNPVLLLWPKDAPDEKTGEIDFCEEFDPRRQYVEGWIHGRTGKKNAYYTGKRRLDLTQWHNFGVEWQPDRIIYFLDGVEWGRFTNQAEIPNIPMHLAMQLGFSRFYTKRTGIPQQTTAEVDWVRIYR